jgi:hypothetical protein
MDDGLTAELEAVFKLVWERLKAKNKDVAQVCCPPVLITPTTRRARDQSPNPIADFQLHLVLPVAH